MAEQPIPAATVVLMRDRKNEAAGPEVLMVERNRNSVTGPGAFVFPGGMLDPQDCDPDLQDLSSALSPEGAAGRINGGLSPQAALGFFMAAIRETFEETLILLAGPKSAAGWEPHGIPEEILLNLREQALGGRAAFFPWLRDQGLRLYTEQMVVFAHWVTPIGNPHRYSTHFFLIEVPYDVQVVPERNEIRSHVWLSPGEALEKNKSGDFHLMAPTARNLEFLAPFGSTAEAMAALKTRKFETIIPKLRFEEGGNRIVIYPWDPDFNRA